MKCHQVKSEHRQSIRRPGKRGQRGKVLVLVAVVLPTLFGMLGLVIDAGFLFTTSRQLQHVADAAATAAARELQLGFSKEHLTAVVSALVHSENDLADTVIEIYTPPLTGEYKGKSNFVEVVLEDQLDTFFIHILGLPSHNRLTVRAVAGAEPSTAGSAIVVLDPRPQSFNFAPLPALPVSSSLPAVTGGLEVLGLGSVSVNGAVLVNTEWGGKDEHGDEVGQPAGLLDLSHAVSATPLVALSRLRARDLRVVGGVDDPNNYRAYVAGNPSPLKAGRLPVPDPFEQLPVPTTSVDPANVNSTLRGGVTVIGLPLLSPPVHLSPGVYEWIEVVSGRAIFAPGVYIIRGKNPVTQLSLACLGGEIHAAGVMFYITDTSDYSAVSPAADALDGESEPNTGYETLPPSVALNIGLFGSEYSGLDAPSSPFHRMLLYQRRHDRRPILIVQENLIAAGQLSGTVYSKWGHVVLVGRGKYDVRIVAGTVRLLTALGMEISPDHLLPPAEDVYLVE